MLLQHAACKLQRTYECGNESYTENRVSYFFLFRRRRLFYYK